MLISISQFGSIRKAEIDTAKPFTVFCGPNNTGKTYVSYLLYAIFSQDFACDSKFIGEIVNMVLEKGEFKMKREYLDQYLAEMETMISQSIGSIFGISDREVSNFKNFKLKLSLSDEEADKIIQDTPLLWRFQTIDFKFEAKKETHSDKITVAIELRSPDGERMVRQLMPLFVCKILKSWVTNGVNGARMLAVERNSIYTFKTELSITRNELVDSLLSSDGKGLNLERILGKGSRRYPLAIRDSLRIANDLVNIQKTNSPFYEAACQIEQEMLGGAITISKDGDVIFTPDTGCKEVGLPIQISSSIVKTLSSLVIYLKFIAKPGDLLIMDEPEMNLHPDNQILLARIFSALQNKGLRVLISTHSDYIVREINNLVMAYELKKLQADGDKSLILYPDSALLNPDNLQVYYFDYKKIKNINMVESVLVDKNRYGFNVSSIDNVINQQNDITESLYDTLSFRSKETTTRPKDLRDLDKNQIMHISCPGRFYLNRIL